jgi:hypothetical protein
MKRVDEAIAEAIRTSCGARKDKPMPLTILAHDEAEATAMRRALKGKHGAKAIEVRVASSDEFVPLMDRARGDVDG